MTLWDESPRAPLTEEQIRAVHRRAFEREWAWWRPRATDTPEPKPKQEERT